MGTERAFCQGGHATGELRQVFTPATAGTQQRHVWCCRTAGVMRQSGCNGSAAATCQPWYLARWKTTNCTEGAPQARRALRSCTLRTASAGCGASVAASRIAYTSHREACRWLRGRGAHMMQHTSAVACCWSLPLGAAPPVAWGGITKAAARCTGRTPCSGGAGRRGHAAADSAAAAAGGCCPGRGCASASATSPRPADTSIRPVGPPAACTSTAEGGSWLVDRPPTSVSCGAGTPVERDRCWGDGARRRHWRWQCTRRLPGYIVRLHACTCPPPLLHRATNSIHAPNLATGCNEAPCHRRPRAHRTRGEAPAGAEAPPDRAGTAPAGCCPRRRSHALPGNR